MRPSEASGRISSTRNPAGKGCLSPSMSAGFLNVSMRAYPNFFTAHSISFASTSKQQARSTMEQYVSHIKAELSQALRADSNVRQDAFSSDFQEPEFIEFVLTNLLTLLAQQKDTCEILLEVIRRSLYESRA